MVIGRKVSKLVNIGCLLPKRLWNYKLDNDEVYEVQIFCSVYDFLTSTSKSHGTRCSVCLFSQPVILSFKLSVPILTKCSHFNYYVIWYCLFVGYWFVIVFPQKMLSRNCEEWPSRLTLCDRTGRFPIQFPQVARLGLGTQPHFEVPGDLWVEPWMMQWLTSSEWDCPLDNGSKLPVGKPNNG